MAPADPSPTYLAFRVGRTGYALDVRQVREVIEPVSRVRVPHAPAVVWGAMNHRGKVYAVVDATMWLTNGAKRYDAEGTARVILLEDPSHRVALLVDSIETVGTATPADENTAEENRFAGGSARVEGILVRLLDTSQLLRELDQMIEHVGRVRH